MCSTRCALPLLPLAILSAVAAAQVPPPARPTPTAATLVLAAADSMHPRRADYRCSGSDDQVTLQHALDALPAEGGRVVLLEGTYSWFDEGSQAPVIRSGVEIRGMGAASRVLVRADVTPFVLRAVTDAALCDLSIDFDPAVEHTGDAIRLEASALGERTWSNRVERVRIVAHADDAELTGLRLFATDAGGGAGVVPGVYRNVVRDVSMERVRRGLVLETAGSDLPWINGNAFENVWMYRFETGVEFVQPSPTAGGANRNLFTDVKMQSGTGSMYGFKDVGRRGNVFVDCLVWDWFLAAAPVATWSIAPTAEDTFIQTTVVPPDFTDEGLRTTVVGGDVARFGGELEVAGSRLHVAPDGRIGIGTRSPQSRLSMGRNYANEGPAAVDLEADSISFVDDNGGLTEGEVRAKIAVFQEVDGPTGQIWADVTGLGFFTETGGPGHNLAERMRIDARGRVGIGTDRPTAGLDVAAAAGHDQLRLRASYTPASSADPAGEPGTVAWDEEYLYLRSVAGWRRVALEAW